LKAYALFSSKMFVEQVRCLSVFIAAYVVSEWASSVFVMGQTINWPVFACQLIQKHLECGFWVHRDMGHWIRASEERNVTTSDSGSHCLAWYLCLFWSLCNSQRAHIETG
jgi:hypothetical protein